MSRLAGEDAIGSIQYRDTLQDRFPLRTSLSRLLATAVRGLPRFYLGKPPYRRPSVWHRFLWQASLAWMGRNGEYSDASAFCARKRES